MRIIGQQIRGVKFPDRQARKVVSKALPGEESFQVMGLDLAVGEELLDGRKLQNDAQKGSQCPVTEEDAVIENEVLEFVPLNGHDNRSVHGIPRGDNP